MECKKKTKKVKDLIIIYICYILAYTVSYFIYKYINNTILALFAFDISATIIIYLCGVIFKNSSVYDPYWSLTPFIMLLLLMIDKELYSVNNILFLIIYGIWSNRLTINWMITFKDLKVQDWRYQMYKDNHPKLWQFINFFGINLFPTILVFLGMLPAIILIQEKIFSIYSLFGYIIMLIGIILEFVSDHQVHEFLRQSSPDKRKVCDKGLWNYSRHPNYLGEISIWYGVFFIMLPIRSDLYYLIIGAVMITCLLLFISIPMMEKRQVNRREEYRRYQEEVSVLLILPKRKR